MNLELLVLLVLFWKPVYYLAMWAVSKDASDKANLVAWFKSLFSLVFSKA